MNEADILRENAPNITTKIWLSQMIWKIIRFYFSELSKKKVTGLRLLRSSLIFFSESWEIFVLDTHNPDRLILISLSTVGTFNLRIDTYPLNFNYSSRVRLPCGIWNKDKINMQIKKDLDKALRSISAIHPSSALIKWISPCKPLIKIF